jgi:general secretion pathway protein D
MADQFTLPCGFARSARPDRHMFFVRMIRIGVWLVAAALAGWSQTAADYYKQGRKAERDGEFARAYLLYAQAAALEPAHPVYWARSHAIRTRAALQAKALPAGISNGADSQPVDDYSDLTGEVSSTELAEARKPQPPQELKGDAALKSFDLRGDAKALFEQVARAYGLDVVFDGDYQPGPPQRFRMDDADYRTALHTLEAVTASFLVPISERVALVVKDTPQKRQEVEPNVILVIPIPEPVTIQEAQEAARSVQQVMEIQKFTIDSTRRIVVLRDQISKARPAQALFEQLLHHKAQVIVEVEFLDVSESSSLSYGLRLPTSIPLVNFGRFWNSAPSIPAGFTRFAVFGGGKTLLGLGIADAELFASMSKFSGRTLLKSEVRSVDGQVANFHVGDKYPIITTGYFGPTPVADSRDIPVYTPPPTINFEDLGLVLKITPRVHGIEDVTLEVEAEFKVLTGEALNGIPVIATRKFQSKVRMREGESAIMAGLMNSTEARTITGIAGLASIPILGPLVRQNTRSKDRRETLLVLRPRLISPPPSEIVTREFWVGSETRPLTQI